MTFSFDDKRALERAKRYPYEAPRVSYVLAGTRMYELDRPPVASAFADLAAVRATDPANGHSAVVADLPAAGLDRDAVGARVPVLAYGANRSAEGLKRKHSALGFPADAAIIVLRARLHGFDVVYSAHLSPYASVGATLQRSPGTSAEVCVALLTPAQLASLGETEPNYTLEELDRAGVELEAGYRPLDRVRAWISRHGCLVLDGAEVALTAIPARDRRFAERTEPEVLAAVAARLGHAGELDEFILENVAQPELAAARTRELRRNARPLD